MATMDPIVPNVRVVVYDGSNPPSPSRFLGAAFTLADCINAVQSEVQSKFLQRYNKVIRPNLEEYKSGNVYRLTIYSDQNKYWVLDMMFDELNIDDVSDVVSDNESNYES